MSLNFGVIYSAAMTISRAQRGVSRGWLTEAPLLNVLKQPCWLGLFCGCFLCWRAWFSHGRLSYSALSRKVLLAAQPKVVAQSLILIPSCSRSLLSIHHSMFVCCLFTVSPPRDGSYLRAGSLCLAQHPEQVLEPLFSLGGPTNCVTVGPTLLPCNGWKASGGDRLVTGGNI